MDDLIRELEQWFKLSRRAWQVVEAVPPGLLPQREEAVEAWLVTCEGVLLRKIAYDTLTIQQKGVCGND